MTKPFYSTIVPTLAVTPVTWEIRGPTNAIHEVKIGGGSWLSN